MNFTLNILGTASALPIVNRYPSAQVLDVRGRLFLIDCGEGVQIQMRRQHLSILKLDTIFITHLHGDHVFGIFGLLSTMGMLGRTACLNIFAPASFGAVLSFFLSTFGEGLRFRIEHHVLDSQEPEVIFQTRTTELLSFPLRHRIETYGFIVREKEPAFNVRKECIRKYGLSLAEIGTLKRGEDVVRPAGVDAGFSMEDGFARHSGTGEPLVIPVSEAAYKPFRPRSYAYCSDTAPFPELAGWVRGVDLLYHEATYPSEMKDLAEKTFHSTTEDAARCALEAGAGRLVIGHYSSRFRDLAPFLEQTRAIFPESSLAHEGDVIEIPLERAGKQ